MELKESKDNEMQAEEKFTAQSEQWKTKMESADRKIDTLEMTNQDLQASVLKLCKNDQTN